MVVILRAYHLILDFFLNIFVWSEVVCAILLELIIIALIIEVLSSSIICLTVVFDGSVETCSCFELSGISFVWERLGVNLELCDLLTDVFHCFTEIILFSICGEI